MVFKLLRTLHNYERPVVGDCGLGDREEEWCELDFGPLLLENCTLRWQELVKMIKIGQDIVVRELHLSKNREGRKSTRQNWLVLRSR